jgi:pyruvate,water dikinase
MIRELSDAGIRVPGGFVTTAEAFRLFLKENQLTNPVKEQLRQVDEGMVSIR